MKQPKIYFDGRVSKDEKPKFREENRDVEARITDVYFGKHPSPGPFSVDTPIGLHVELKCSGATYDQTFTNMRDITGIMNSYDAKLPKELKGKKTTAYFPNNSARMIGISAIVNQP